MQKATDNALRSAIEQTFGAFISARTEILNDQLVSDQIASVASGNIQSYEVLAQTELSETLWGVTVSAVVSVTKLTSFVQARGVQVEIQGGLFAANIRQQVLNEEAEIEAVRNMVGVLHELFQTAFDYEIEVGSPVATDATSSNWKISLTTIATANENMELASLYLQNTLRALDLTKDEMVSYKELNKDVYIVDFNRYKNDKSSGYDFDFQFVNKIRKQGIALRRVESFQMIVNLLSNSTKKYASLYSVNSGLDRICCQPEYWTPMNYVVYEIEDIRESSMRVIGQKLRRDYNDRQTWTMKPSKYQESYFNKDNFFKFKYIGINLLSSDQQAAKFASNDLLTLDEIGKLTKYTVNSLGIISKYSY